MRTVFAGRPRNAISAASEISDSTHLTYDYKVKRALLEDMEASPYSREEIAVRLSARAGREVSLATLEAWVSTTKINRFPAELLPAWTAVTASKRLIETLCIDMGLSLCSSEDVKFAELGRARLREEKLTQELWEKA